MSDEMFLPPTKLVNAAAPGEEPRLLVFMDHEPKAPVSVESIIESVKVTRRVQDCGHQDGGGGYTKHVGRADYMIKWTEPNGCRRTQFSAYCSHPFCDKVWRLSTSPPRVLDSVWIPNVGTPRLATVYLLLTEDPDGRTLPKVEARIGICSLWRDPLLGNYGEDDDGHSKLFSQRYFAESGPGVFPIPIEDENEWVDIGKVDEEPVLKVKAPTVGDIYGDQLDQVLDAYKVTVNFGNPTREPGTFL